MKKLNPLVVLGFLSASIFWVGVLAWQASYAPTDSEKRQCEEVAKASGHRTEDCKTFWERTTSDPVAFFTFWLVVFTGGLGASTVLLWLASEKQIKLAREAAATQSLDMQASIDAARDANSLSRDIFIADQRPWLKWSIPPVGVLTVNGAKLTLGIRGNLENLGRIPASNISYFGRLYVPPPGVAAVNLGQMYFSEHMTELQRNWFSLASILPTETLQMNFGPEGVKIDGLPETFSLCMAFHARYMFAVGAAPNPRAIAEIGSVYMIQAIGGTTTALKKRDVTSADTPVAIVEFPGARLLT